MISPFWQRWKAGALYDLLSRELVLYRLPWAHGKAAGPALPVFNFLSPSRSWPNVGNL
ncbi:MAG TPA: hypothetical protein VMX38_14655 [Verrucomicrobiae bacterium]|nr:hypothetical protein [Verrucomicrobiae bacterium]